MCGKFMRIIPVLLAMGMLLSGCGREKESWRPAKSKLSLQSESLTVERVENLPQDFIFGMDASCVPALEASGVRYFDHDGVERDVFHILRDNGINYIRIRIWNDPFDENGNGYGGGNCDIENAVAIGRRAAAVGMKLLVNFHYSDFWADPSKQMVPKAWQGMSVVERADAVYSYTKEAFGRDHVFVQPEMSLNGMTVSSSRIRAALEQGDTEMAEKMLGRPYSLDTNVVHGKRLGRTLGFPTANQYFPAERAIPSRGVYAVLCHTPYGVFPGVSNVGIRPTTDSHGRVNCETHIIGMSGDLYGRRIRVEFLSKLRDEQKFNGVDELVEAIRRDAVNAVAVATARGLV